MSKKEQIFPTNVTFNQGKVTSLQFNYNNKTYHAAIKDSLIDFRNGNCHATYDRATKNMAVTLLHVCGAQGFGQSLEDRCPACASSTGKSNSFPAPEHYQKIDQYCQGLEQLMEENPLILDQSEEELKKYTTIEFLAQYDEVPVWSSDPY